MELVTDTTIWIDLNRGNLLDEMFRVGDVLRAPDVIVEELEEPPGTELVRRGLKATELSGKQVLEVEAMVLRYRRPSRPDLFALVLARVRQATPMTGDRELRRAAEAEHVVVHGTLWTLDRMVSGRVLAARRAADALELMMRQSRWLPPAEVNRRLKRWRR